MLYERGAGMALGVTSFTSSGSVLKRERLMHDGQFSVVGRTNGVAEPALYRYDAWGGFRSTAQPGVGQATLAYAGQHWDADLGLSYAQQRWYEPGSGRFLSEDPVAGDPSAPNSLMAFGYAGGNPLTFTDPLGTTICMPGDPGSCFQEAEETQSLVEGCAKELGPDGKPHGERWCRNEFTKAEGKGLVYGAAGGMLVLAPEVAVAGGLIGFGLDATRQGVKQIETQRPGFDWGEAADSTAMGMAAAPVCSAPGVKQVFIWGGGALGVKSAYDEGKAGHPATALLDLAAATLPVAAEYGPKLPDFSLPRPAPVRVAATTNGGTVVVAGEEAPASRKAPDVFESRARAGEQTSVPPADPAFKNGWKLDPSKDADWRGAGKTVRDALAEAFRRTGVPSDQFEVTRWARDAQGKSFPVEWKAAKGGEVSIDVGHSRKGPGVPHVGYQTPGKQRIRGHILLDDVNANR